MRLKNELYILMDRLEKKQREITFEIDLVSAWIKEQQVRYADAQLGRLSIRQ